MPTATENVIEVTNAGPVEGTFEIDLSKGPGVYEFRGARGSGKTTCISSIDCLAGHKVDITLHDGAISGKIEGFGVVAPIGGNKRRKGELDLDTIDAEKFTLGDLLDPQGKTPEVRDATAIKALAALSGAKADPTLYYEVAGGQAEFDALGIDETDDPVLLASRIKNAFDKLARQKTLTAEAEAKHAAPLEHIPEGLDIEQSCDLKALGDARDAARDTAQKLKTERANGLAKEVDIDMARSRLKTIQEGYTGPSIEEAEAARQTAIDEGTAAKARVEELQRELEKAKSAVEVCTANYHAANKTLEAAKSHFAAIDELQSLASETVTYPEESAIAEAEVAVKEAGEAYDQGLRIRDVRQNLVRAKGHRESAKLAESEAAAAKNKASQVFDVLASSLKTKYLKIESVDGNPRLFVKHPKRGKTVYDRKNGLSDGERVDFVLRELLPYLETPGLLPIPQRYWQDLQPADRESLHELAVEKGLYLFGAQVDDGQLRVMYLGDE